MQKAHMRTAARTLAIAAMPVILATQSIAFGRDASELEGVVMTTGQTRYAHGDSAAVVITNHSDDVVLFSVLCGMLVEGQVEGTWRTVFQPDCSRIRVRPTRLAPGERHAATCTIAPCAPDSLALFETFRLSLRVQNADSGGTQSVHSAPFDVTPDAHDRSGANDGD